MPTFCDIDSRAVDQYVAENALRCIVLVVDDTPIGYSVTKENLIDLMMIRPRAGGWSNGVQLEAIERSALMAGESPCT